ncbi:hypothetical protein BDY21DRAFT_380266 [Lineolata rhizophorae]|uniref:Uncharacterized protein n=1 Tax=Lineolata rhizophorae TaxID=578093 RepID=A0A6A6NXA8_9PEZI|nr:hypothetical protein BDY21DRAFT_380266 [Lineolata rhizophorae]
MSSSPHHGAIHLVPPDDARHPTFSSVPQTKVVRDAPPKQRTRSNSAQVPVLKQQDTRATKAERAMNKAMSKATKMKAMMVKAMMMMMLVVVVVVEGDDGRKR